MEYEHNYFTRVAGAESLLVIGALHGPSYTSGEHIDYPVSQKGLSPAYSSIFVRAFGTRNSW